MAQHKIYQETGTSQEQHGDNCLLGVRQSEKELPKVFWQYYDLYRRGKITIDEYRSFSGISAPLLSIYLSSIQ